MLIRFKPKKCRTVLGVDIGATSVKTLGLSYTNNKPCIDSYGCEVLPSHVIEGNNVKDIEALSASIKKLIFPIKSSAIFVVLAVPDSIVITKTIQCIKNLIDFELEELVHAEANKYLACPSDELNIDFTVLGTSLSNRSMLDVWLVASRSDPINRRVEAVRRAGLHTNVVDVESYALARVGQLLISNDSCLTHNRAVAVLEINSLLMRLSILEGGKITHSREERVAKNSSSIYSEPEESPFHLATFILQVKRIIEFFFSTSPYKEIEHIFLAGDLARSSNLDYKIQKETGINTTVVNPFKHMDISTNLNSEMLENFSPSLLIACGLALRRIDND